MIEEVVRTGNNLWNIMRTFLDLHMDLGSNCFTVYMILIDLHNWDNQYGLLSESLKVSLRELAHKAKMDIRKLKNALDKLEKRQMIKVVYVKIPYEGKDGTKHKRISIKDDSEFILLNIYKPIELDEIPAEYKEDNSIIPLVEFAEEWRQKLNAGQIKVYKYNREVSAINRTIKRTIDILKEQEVPF
ncbi:MAG: hypothetical protein ACE14V_13920 [bacterium]